MTERNDLMLLKVNLVPNAVAALNKAAGLCGDTKTDTVNRALQVYAALIEASLSDSAQRVQWDVSAAGVGPTTVVVMPPPVPKLGWRERRRARRLGSILDALGRHPEGMFVPDLAKEVDRHPVSLYADLALLEGQARVRSWWADGPHPRRRLYARSS